MFGYIKPFKPDLKMKEYDAYRAVYCGLCRQLGSSFGFFSRLTLSYDFTFLGMLCYALNGTVPEVSMQRCCVNPFRQVPMCAQDDTLRYAADISLMMIYYKLLDNIQDSGLIKKAGYSLLRPIAAGARNHAQERCPKEDAVLMQLMVQQRAVEQLAGASPDAAAQPTAAALAALCGGLCPTQDPQLRTLDRFGYLLGRYIYLCDALDDLDDDAKSGNFNPLLADRKPPDKEVLEQARASLYMTISELEKAANLLDFKVFEPVIENIITLGLRDTVDGILSKKEKAG